MRRRLIRNFIVDNPVVALSGFAAGTLAFIFLIIPAANKLIAAIAAALD